MKCDERLIINKKPKCKFTIQKIPSKCREKDHDVGDVKKILKSLEGKISMWKKRNKKKPFENNSKNATK